MRSVHPEQPPPPPLPRGRHSPGGEVVASSQRTRILDALVELVAEEGYPAVRVGRVARRARVSLSSFYTHFENKEECFLAAYDSVVEGLLADLQAAVAAHDDPDAGLDAAVRAYFSWFSVRPEAARTFLIEIRRAGPAALTRRAEVVERFLGLLVDHLRGAAGEAAVPPRSRLVVLAAGLEALAHEEVLAGRTEGMTAVAPDAIDVLRRLLGPDHDPRSTS